ncbi:MAG: DUF3365 domain-containing protein [Nitrospira sp.]
MPFSQRMLWGAALLGLAIGGAIVLYPARTLPGASSICVSMDMVANYLHAVIEADRDSYTRHIVERMQTKGIVVASENWETRHTLPLPAQFLMESGRHLEKKGVGIQYRLISLWPINKRNVATTPLQKTALGAIATQPDHPFTGVTKVGDTRYYEAVYPDLAITQAFIGCHNAHPDSPKRDFKVNDVMGAIVISIQLGPGFPG